MYIKGKKTGCLHSSANEEALLSSPQYILKILQKISDEKIMIFGWIEKNGKIPQSAGIWLGMQTYPGSFFHCIRSGRDYGTLVSIEDIN